MSSVKFKPHLSLSCNIYIETCADVGIISPGCTHTSHRITVKLYDASDKLKTLTAETTISTERVTQAECDNVCFM